MRTTLDIEKPVLDGLKQLQREEKQSLSRLASGLLAEALAHRLKNTEPSTEPTLEWSAEAMGARIDIADKEALNRALDAR